MYYDTELDEFIEYEYKDYVFNDVSVMPLKKDDIKNVIENFMNDLINDIKNNLGFTNIACIMLKLFALFSIGILCLLAYLLSYFLDKLLAYLMNLLDKIIKTIMDKIKTVLNAIFDKLREILNKIEEAIEKIKNAILQIIAFIENLISQLLAFIESIINALLTILDRFFEFINNLIAWLMNCLSIPEIPGCIVDFGIDIQADNLGTGPVINEPDFSLISDDNYTPIPIIDEIINDFNNTKDQMQGLISSTISNINTSSTILNINKLDKSEIDKTNQFEKGINLVNDLLDNLQNRLLNLVDNINSKLKNNLANYDSDLYNSIYNLTERDYSNLNDILNYFNNTLDNIIDNNIQGILNDLEKQFITGEIC